MRVKQGSSCSALQRYCANKDKTERVHPNEMDHEAPPNRFHVRASWQKRVLTFIYNNKCKWDTVILSCRDDVKKFICWTEVHITAGEVSFICIHTSSDSLATTKQQMRKASCPKCVRARARVCVRTLWLMMYITWHWRSFSLCHLNTSDNCRRRKWPERVTWCLWDEQCITT